MEKISSGPSNEIASASDLLQASNTHKLSRTISGKQTKKLKTEMVSHTDRITLHPHPVPDLAGKIASLLINYVYYPFIINVYLQQQVIARVISEEHITLSQLCNKVPTGYKFTSKTAHSPLRLAPI